MTFEPRPAGVEALTKMEDIPGTCAEGYLVSWMQNVLGQSVGGARVTGHVGGLHYVGL